MNGSLNSQMEELENGAQFPLRPFMAGILLSWILITTIVYLQFRAFSDLREAKRSLMSLQELQDRIIYLDEVLTMSAKMAAVSGDFKWVKRYKSYKPELDSALNQLKVLSPNLFATEYVAMTAEANKVLVNIESNVLALAKRGRLKEARALIYGDMYLEQRELYSLGMKRFHIQVNRDLIDRDSRLRRDRFYSMGACTLIGIFLVLLWLYMYKALLNWKKSIMSFKQQVSTVIEKRTEELEVAQQKSFASAKLASLGEMAGGVAHEINNPLAIINGNASKLLKLVKQDKIDHQKLMDLAVRIKATTLRIAQIVRGMRTVTRDSEADVFCHFPVKEILNDTLVLCQQRMKNHEVDLEVDPVRDDLQVYCNPVQLSQVILNLLNNAHDAIQSQNDKWIQLSVKESDSTLEIAVTDSGNGIAEDIRAKILDPFFTTKPVGKGTGLGLSIASGIIDKHNGQFNLDAECPNTRFIIRLPLAEMDEPRDSDDSDKTDQEKREAA